MTCVPCCPESRLIETDMRTMVCTQCGGETFGLSMMGPINSWGMEIRPSQTYTREKRFRKYLQRASRQQSIGSVPEETWQYLLARRPFQGPKHIVLTLKHARNLHKKCYDCLPLLVHHLCPEIFVPSLSEDDKMRARSKFRVIDRAYDRDGPFVSYLFALEYVLRLISRDDMLPIINKIQCPQRRDRYNRKFDAIFKAAAELSDTCSYSSAVRVS